MNELLMNFLGELWHTTTDMAPYLLFGFLMAGILAVFIRPETVERHLGPRGFGSIFKAALFGVPLPLCSCGVIPVSASLRRHGASRGATTAFLISTPQTGVDSILVTYSLLGPFFAVFRPVISLITGLAGGTLADVLAGSNGSGSALPAGRDACCTDSPGHPLARVFTYGFGTLARDIARPLLAGLLIAGVIAAVVPGDFMQARVGTGFLPMIVVMAVAIPLYVCATASVPIAAALITAGFSPGAALVFLMTGPATNAATITTLWKIMGRRTTIIYVMTVALAALGAGLLMDYVIALRPHLATVPAHAMLPPWLSTGSAVALLALLTRHALPRRCMRGHGLVEQGPAANASLTLSVHGMSCSHCADAVKRALLEIDGVTDAEVDLEQARAVVRGTAVNGQTLRIAVESLGYSARILPEEQNQGDAIDSCPRD